MDKLSKSDLVELCKKRGIKGYSGKNKIDLVSLLENVAIVDEEDKTKKKNLGQYFTVCQSLQQFVFDNAIYKKDKHVILEPSFGAGHLLKKFKEYDENYPMVCYEIDDKIKPIINFNSNQTVIYGDFTTVNFDSKLKSKLNPKLKSKLKFKTIIGNPPYVKIKSGNNLYLKFIKICYDLLEDDGELLFIVPSDFIKLTSASKIIKEMVGSGSFTHFYFPNDEKLFEDANVDVMVFRYQKGIFTNKTILNDKEMICVVNEGIITFRNESENESDNKENKIIISDMFDVYVGIVSGKDEVYRSELGNIEVLTDKDKYENFIFTKSFPSGNVDIDNHLSKHKDILLSRKIKKFSEKNWFEWGAPRNINVITNESGKDCIYIRTIMRVSSNRIGSNREVCFSGKVGYFGGSLLCLIPKKDCNRYNQLKNVIDYLNSERFQKNYIYSGRFKIGHKQICNAELDL